MTVAGSDDLGDLLTASLRGCVYPVDLVGVTEHLLPVVTAWADARARERAAEAWDEGYDAGYLHVPPHHAVNPYRADALAADDREGQR